MDGRKNSTPEEVREYVTLYVCAVARTLRYQVLPDDRTPFQERMHTCVQQMYENIPAQALVAKEMVKVIATDRGLDARAMTILAATTLEGYAKRPGNHWPKKLPRRVSDWQAIEEAGLDIMLAAVSALSGHPQNALCEIEQRILSKLSPLATEPTPETPASAPKATKPREPKP